jgi:hypothetical protein
MRLRVALLATLTLSVGAAAQPEESLATRVPADVGLFIELRNAGDLLLPLVEPQMWLTVAELAGQPANLAEMEQWQHRVAQVITMSPADAVRTLFAHRVAFIAGDARQTQDAVILCRPTAPAPSLIAHWPAQPLPSAGRTSVYRLPYNVGLAVQPDLMLLGDHVGAGLFDRALAHLDSPKPAALSADPVFARLLGRVPPNPDGVFFARRMPATPSTQVATQSSTAPAPPLDPPAWWDWLLPLPGAEQVLLALHRDAGLLHLHTVGDGPRPTQPTDGAAAALLRRLPRRTLLAWAGPVDYAIIKHGIQRLPEQNLLRVMSNVHERPGTVVHLTEALHPSVCLAFGAVTPATRELPAPPIPCVALLLPARDAEAVAQAWTELLHSTVAMYRLLLLKVGTSPQLPPLEPLTLAGVSAECLDLSRLLSPEPSQTPLGELHLCWALDDDVLIIASHTAWLAEILEARRAGLPPLVPLLSLSPGAAPTATSAPTTAPLTPATVLVAQPGPLADLGQAWLHFFQESMPAVLNEKFWQRYQPGGGNVRLGIQVLVEREEPRLRVQSVTPGLPAEGVLQPDDAVIGCNRRRFATSQPAEELRRGLAQRPNARWVDLLVERDRVVRVKRIALPFVDPIDVLWRLVAVGQVVQRVVYLGDIPDPAGPRGLLTIELRSGAPPLFDFPTTAAASPRALSAPAN